MKFSIIFGLVFFCASALATTYECGLLVDNAGAAIPGRAKYFVTVPPTTMGTLPAKIVLNSGKPITMTTSSSSSAGVIYTSSETAAQIYYSIAPAMPGLPTFAMTLMVPLNGDQYRASCPGNPLPMTFKPAQGNSGMCYEMPDCEGGSLGVMNASSCSSVGRSWLDDSDGSCSNF